MGTIDSGTETLFSDESPCDLVPSPCSGDDVDVRTKLDNRTINGRSAPPNIQPYSGVLEKGKVVIRPIAFKPSTINMNVSTRFGMAGERYGSTPILTRPGSRLTLYGSSNDLRQAHALTNYSLDRKLRSASSGVDSLASLPHRRNLLVYDSLDSVRKSPASPDPDNKDANNNNNNNNSSNSNNGMASASASASSLNSLLDLTPSPSDSGVSELEAALRDRDSELAYLRQTMEHNEQVIFRVYQEKEKVWERELKRLKTVQDNRLRASSQKVLKLEQMLMMQTYQIQQDKKRMCADVQRSNLQCERLRQEVASLKTRLEETEWGLCQKTGEISLLKTQLKELQLEQTTKCQELVQIRSDQKYLRAQLDDKTDQLERLKRLDGASDESPEPTQHHPQHHHHQPNHRRLHHHQAACEEAAALRDELRAKGERFESERLTWLQEKEKVLQYQRRLQMNYVQMFRRTRALEAELQQLGVELELDQNGVKRKLELSQIIDL
ncbi:unnamed protein product [Phyllotreta striolata]|uniref:Uncharacterized protein n=1 Tax=Phyllotreta striolata TaxID=444603 RepID=A0A9N9TL26_PHYSR|nr:unnamed protein product [Phyllotreta striolata]